MNGTPGIQIETGRPVTAGDNVHYFLGIDPAPALGQKSDDGALAALKVQPKPGITSPAGLDDWQADYVWAYKLRGASARQWSGLVHKKHGHFRFSGINLDAGAGGQGPAIMLELHSNLQLIDDINTRARPIATPDDSSVAHGEADFILTFFKRKDVTVDLLWPSHTMMGDDNLWHNCHTVFQEAVEQGRVGFPVPFNHRPAAETSLLPREANYALRVLSQGMSQLINIAVETVSDGTYAVTRHGALSFTSIGKKDIAYAMILAYVRFLIWLKGNEQNFELSGKDAKLFKIMK